MLSPLSVPEPCICRCSLRSAGAALACAWLLSAVSMGCATITQEDPPSRLAGAPPSSAGAGGRSNMAPLAEMTALPSSPSAPGAASNSSEEPPPSGLSSAGSGGAAPVGMPDAGQRPAPGTVLLEESFESFAATSPAWTSSEGGAWEIVTDEERESTVYAQTETARSEPNLAVAGDFAWRDVRVEADVQIQSFNGSNSSYLAGLCVRVRDPESFYLVGIRSNDGRLGLRRYVDGGTNLVQSELEPLAIGVWYRLRVEVVGSTITAYVDDQLAFTHADDDLPSGAVGLCTVRAAARFDNVRVTVP